MKNFFAKSICTLLTLCLALTGCAHNQQKGTVAEVPETTATDASPEGISEVVAVETVSIPMPANIALGDDWCYIRFNLTREELNELADTTDNDDITLSVPSCTPGGDDFCMNITKEDVTKSLQLLDANPGQLSVNLIKPLSSDIPKSMGETEDDLYYIFYLLTQDDVLRMLDALQLTNSNILVLKQRLDVESDKLAMVKLEYSALVQCLEILNSTDQTCIPYVCPVNPPGTGAPSIEPGQSINVL